MSQGDDGGTGGSTVNGGSHVGSHGGGRRIITNGNGSGDIASLIQERQDAAGSTQVLDLSYANLDSFPTEIEVLGEVLEKLTMSHNSIRSLPLQLMMFTSLRYLNIRANSIRTFPQVLCQLSSLEILDMSRNKIARFPDSFGNLMNLRVLSISRNRIEAIPTYIGEMNQLQFLKIEQNPIVFPPSGIVEFPVNDMEGWLNRLKTFLLSHKANHESQVSLASNEDPRDGARQEATSILTSRSNRSASLDGMGVPHNHRQGKGEAALRLSIPNTLERHGNHTANLSPDPMAQKMARTTSHHGSHGEDQYRFISHSRGVSGDSTSSFGSNASNDCDKYSDVYFQRLATYPPLQRPLPGDRMRLVEAARGILFALCQIYKAVKQIVNCSNDEKFNLLFTRLLQSASSTMTQLIQSLDRFDSSAQIQVPDQNICGEVMRCCESNVGSFKKLVHMVQTQIRNISIVADVRLVRNLVLMLHGALSEIRYAWDSLLPLLQGSGEINVEIIESSQLVKDHQPTNSSQNQHHSTNIPGIHPPHPFQLSPTIPTSSGWFPSQAPHRGQNMSRTSNHSGQSANNMYNDDEEDTQLLVTVEHAIEAARRLVQSLTETCMTRVENIQSSPQHRPLHRTRSVSASPPRSGGSTGSGGTNANGKGSPQDVQTAAMSPLQLGVDMSSATVGVPPTDNNPNHTNGAIVKSDSGLMRSPLFSPGTDIVPYSNGMCVSLPIGQSAMSSPEITSTNSTRPGDESPTKHEKRPGTHSKVSSKTSFDPALPSIPQDEASEINSQTQTSTTILTTNPTTNSTTNSTSSTTNTVAISTVTATTTTTSTPQYHPVMTARSASVSGLPSNSFQTTSSVGTPTAAASSLPSQGFMGTNSVHPHLPQGHGLPTTPWLYSSSSSSFPFPTAGVVHLPAAQLWREMKDCLLQMTEIVKRLDLDLTMIKTDDHLYHPHSNHHLYHHQHGQFHPHTQISHQNHIYHNQQHGAPQLGARSTTDDIVMLRRRFGMGVSDFFKSVVVISTLIKQLSTNITSPTSSRATSATTAVIASSSSSSPSLSTNNPPSSPLVPRTRSGSAVDSSSLNTPTSHTNSVLPTSAIGTEILPNLYSTACASITPPSLSASSSAAGAALHASPEKLTTSQSRQNQSTKPTSQSQQQGSDVFSQHVMTNISNLTKITQELTVRMPRSSFRDYLLSSSSAGGGMGAGIVGIPNGGNIGSHGFGYGPAGASILAMRKGSLI
ncbi:RAM signaling network component [Entomortierella beljakovae]|nr:RAM signaling network component [Entomortierella beljakovae]